MKPRASFNLVEWVGKLGAQRWRKDISKKGKFPFHSVCCSAKFSSEFLAVSSALCQRHPGEHSFDWSTPGPMPMPYLQSWGYKTAKVFTS